MRKFLLVSHLYGQINVGFVRERVAEDRFFELFDSLTKISN